MNKGATADRTREFGTRVSAIAMAKTTRKKLRGRLTADRLRIRAVPAPAAYEKMATMGMNVSGRAVPIAASILPPHSPRA
jgi:hypothetical protein